MKILILDGHPDPSPTLWDKYLTAFDAALSTGGAAAERVALRDLKIQFCHGCWSCWWATPGVCSRRDDMTSIIPAVLQADLTVWASPLIMGNVSAVTKKTQDRMIPVLQPFFKLSAGEFHHRRRYDKKINVGLLIMPGASDTDEDARIVRRLHERLAVNLHGQLKFFSTTALDAAKAASLACQAVGSAAEAAREVYHETIGA